MRLDKTDREILRLLQQDCSLSNLELSKKIGMSPSTCLARTKALRSNGYIDKCTAILNRDRLGLSVTAYTLVNLKCVNAEALGEFIRLVSAMTNVQECYTITGNYVFLLKVVCRDMSDYRDWLVNRLMSNPNVIQVQTNMVMSTDKSTTELDVDAIDTEPTSKGR